MISSARLLADQLAALGADLVFGVPGESYLAVLDALHGSTDLRYITCRQESGATFAADAHARLTGRPGIAMVTRGPGATNASIGVHTAFHDEIPMLLFVGLIPSHQVGRGAFQEFDLEGMFRALAKDVVTMQRPEDIGEIVAHAWWTSSSGRPGPVVIGLPEDLLESPVPARLATTRTVEPDDIDATSLASARALIAGAERPLAVVGGSTWTETAVAALPRVLAGVPLATAFRHQDLLDDRHPASVGVLGLANDPALVTAVRDADLLIALGTRLDDPTTKGFTLLPATTPLIHVHPSATEVGRNHAATVGVVGDPGSFLSALGPTQREPSTWLSSLRVTHEAWSAGGGALESLARTLGETLPRDVIVTNGAGNFSRAFHRSFPYGRPGRQLAPANGSMGYGLPAAVAASLARPDQSVVCVAGDGDLLMTGQEMATARAFGARLTVLVIDNSSYGTIRTHQERRYPGRRVATDLVNPDFAQWARSFGAQAWTTDDCDEAAGLVEAAVASRSLSLVHLRTDA